MKQGACALPGQRYHALIARFGYHPWWWRG
jgi:hypothetical protein